MFPFAFKAFIVILSVMISVYALSCLFRPVFNSTPDILTQAYRVCPMRAPTFSRRGSLRLVKSSRCARPWRAFCRGFSLVLFLPFPLLVRLVLLLLPLLLLFWPFPLACFGASLTGCFPVLPAVPSLVPLLLVLAFALAFLFSCVFHSVLRVLYIFPLFWVLCGEGAQSSVAFVPVGCSGSLDELMRVDIDHLLFALVLVLVFALPLSLEGSLCY